MSSVHVHRVDMCTCLLMEKPLCCLQAFCSAVTAWALVPFGWICWLFVALVQWIVALLVALGNSIPRVRVLHHHRSIRQHQSCRNDASRKIAPHLSSALMLPFWLFCALIKFTSRVCLGWHRERKRPTAHRLPPTSACTLPQCPLECPAEPLRPQADQVPRQCALHNRTACVEAVAARCHPSRTNTNSLRQYDHIREVLLPICFLVISMYLFGISHRICVSRLGSSPSCAPGLQYGVILALQYVDNQAC